VQLTDGGVYDNIALEAVWKDWSHVLISDCGAPFEQRSDSSPLRRLLRHTAVVTSQTRALWLRAFFADIREGRYRGVYAALSSGADPAQSDALGYSQELTAGVIEGVRIDLNGFTEAAEAISDSS
jgi:NTE family protein